MNPAAWTQNYTPGGMSLIVAGGIASIPVVVLLGALAFFHLKAHVAALLGLVLALLIATLFYGMPATTAAMAALNGAAFGLMPIGWIVLNAIFVYDVTIKTGKFEVVKDTIAGLAGDRRIQVLLIAFAFGAFIEGAAGFGTPVAITAAMLIGLGFKPLQAAGLALIGNTAPVAYGALGTPILTLAKVTGINENLLSAMAGRQLPFFSVIVPFWLVIQMSGFKGMVEVWPACLVAGVFFAIPQFLVSNFYGPSLVDIFAAIVCIGALYLFLKVWQPRNVWRFPEERDVPRVEAKKHSLGEAFLAWMPWLVLSVLVFVWGLPTVKGFLNDIHNPTWEWPLLHNMVNKAPPVAKTLSAEPAKYSLNYLSATGTSLLLTGVIAGLWLRLKFSELVSVYLHTLMRVRFSLLTIAAMLALGYTTKFAGSDSTMGLAFASTGPLFPFFSPLLGWLGVALTGSDTSSNVLFGNLQVVSANQIGMNPILAAASNSSGGVMGKMIDAQSIVVASVATKQDGKEGEILRYVFWHSLGLAMLVGVLVYLQSNVLGFMVPRAEDYPMAPAAPAKVTAPPAAPALGQPAAGAAGGAPEPAK
jgi:lactate permease